MTGHGLLFKHWRMEKANSQLLVGSRRGKDHCNGEPSEGSTSASKTL